jgi:glycosyltransferase involved in cell wall biosynthesis
MSTPTFSVIIPAYNRRDLLMDALDSVWQQRFKDFEVIVVDDGSTDGTTEYLRSLDGRLRFLVQHNVGPGRARNRGLEIAQGTYIAFLDSDDVWFPWTLETYATVTRKHDCPSFIAGKPFRFDTAESVRDPIFDALRTERFEDYLESGNEWRWWGVSSFVIRNDVIRAAGGFSVENMNGEDADLALRLGEARSFVQVISPFTFGYREHPFNATKDLEKTLAGVRHMIQREKSGEYPGGRPRAKQRWRILTRHVRPVSMDCLRQGRTGDAWQSYRSTLRWHIRLGRWKYLLGFPVEAAVRRFRDRGELPQPGFG